MWMTDDWSIAWMDRRHLKSSQPRPHVAMLLTNSSQGAAIMVRPWTRREQFLAFLAGAIAVSGSVFSTLAYFNINP